jgi:pilus assembly protein Flp/PilA
LLSFLVDGRDVVNGLIYPFHLIRAGLTGADEDGQGLVEYGLIIGLIAMMLVTTLSFLGTQLIAAYETVANAIP